MLQIKAIVDDMNSEFRVIQTERNAANDVKKDIYTKLDKCSSELKELEAEQADVVKAKNDALDKLQKIRGEMDVTLQDYRDNRKLSLEVRDQVAAGNVEEARSKAAEQVDALMAKLAADYPYRKEYQQLWAQQRRFLVSELLPDSSVHAAQQGADARGARNGKGAAGGKAGGAARAAPPVPRGKEKAASLIESIMAQASREVASMAAGRPRQDDSDDADDEVEVPVKKVEAPKAAAPAPAKPAQPAKPVADASAAAANVFQRFKVGGDLCFMFLLLLVRCTSSQWQGTHHRHKHTHTHSFLWICIFPGSMLPGPMCLTYHPHALCSAPSHISHCSSPHAHHPLGARHLPAHHTPHHSTPIPT